MGEAVARLEEAAAALAEGGVVVLPTETVYGLACRLDRPEARRRIYELKGRPSDKPLQVLLASAGDIPGVAHADADALALASRFMPGPLTLVLPAREGLPDLGAQGTVGVRVPDHPVTLALLRRTGPLAATSANRSGHTTPERLDELRRLWGDEVDAYLEGGPAPGDRPSTVLDLSGSEPAILRAGALPREAIEEALGRSVRA